MQRYATSPAEAQEIFSQNPDGHIIPVDGHHMPYIEVQSDLPEEDQPRLKQFTVAGEFRLAVYNFSANPMVPFVGFSIEGVGEGLYVEGSTQIIDPSKFRLTKPAIAAMPLLHIFNDQIKGELKKASNLLARASGKQGVTSLTDERNMRMMSAALTATHNVMQALHADVKVQSIKQPKTRADGLAEQLQPTLDAGRSFYLAVIKRASGVFEEPIRTLAEDIALGRYASEVEQTPSI